MSEDKTIGSCFCSKVTYEITGNLGVFLYCHCSLCRKFTGGAFAANILVSPDQFKWLSGEDLVSYYAPEETDWYATSFCKNCGSSLPWLKKSGEAVVIPAGTLDGDPMIKPMHNIFCGSDASWYIEPDTLPHHEEWHF